MCICSQVNGEFTSPDNAVMCNERPIIGFAGTEITGVCRNRGAVGGLQALTALEAHFARVSLQALPAQGGFHAAYAGTGSVYAIYRRTLSTERGLYDD